MSFARPFGREARGGLEWPDLGRRRGGAFAPLSLYAGGYTGNLLDFVAPAGLYSDAGVTLAGMGAQVHSIREQVGGGLISQTVSSFRGVREATGVKLDGFDDYYPLSWTPASEAGAFSVFTVFDLPAALSANGMVFGSTRGTGPRFAVYVTVPGVMFFSYSATQVAIFSSGFGARFSVAITRDGPAATGTVRVYVNGILYATVPPAVDLSGLPVAIGARGDGLADWIAIRARGWLHINRLLTDDERASLATYWS